MVVWRQVDPNAENPDRFQFGRTNILTKDLKGRGRNPTKKAKYKPAGGKHGQLKAQTEGPDRDRGQTGNKLIKWRNRRQVRGQTWRQGGDWVTRQSEANRTDRSWQTREINNKKGERKPNLLTGRTGSKKTGQWLKAGIYKLKQEQIKRGFDTRHTESVFYQTQTLYRPGG